MDNLAQEELHAWLKTACDEDCEVMNAELENDAVKWELELHQYLRLIFSCTQCLMYFSTARWHCCSTNERVRGWSLVGAMIAHKALGHQARYIICYGFREGCSKKIWEVCHDGYVGNGQAGLKLQHLETLNNLGMFLQAREVEAITKMIPVPACNIGKTLSTEAERESVEVIQHLKAREANLQLRDEMPSHMGQKSCQYADGRAAMVAIAECCTTFGTVSQGASEQEGHFANTLTQPVARQLMETHYFTSDYVSWAKGAVEVACRSVLKALRRVCSEFDMSFMEWTEVFPIECHQGDALKETDWCCAVLGIYSAAGREFSLACVTERRC
jgi:hypothetical protein